MRHDGETPVYLTANAGSGTLLIGPAVLYIVLLVGIPFFMALYYSVSNTTTGGGTLGFVGLRNFTDVIGTLEIPNRPAAILLSSR